MGARINFVFKDSAEGPSVVLYSHWGQDSWVALKWKLIEPEFAMASVALKN